jgi:hypothetical protein
MTRHSYHERDYASGQAMLKLRMSIGLTQAGLAAQGNPEPVAGSIPVLYDPNHPSEAKIHSFEGLWLTSGQVMLLGAGLSLLFTDLFVSVLR